MVMPVTVEDVAGWDADLRALTDGLGGLFQRPEPRRVFADFVRALLADVPKKNSWGLAEHAGYATARPFEHLLDGAVWDVGALRDAVRDYVVEHLGSDDAALIADDTSVIKKGTRSVGVAPQYCGLTGQTENCQVMPMLSYATETGHAFIDRELYLPAAWVEDPARCKDAGVPAPRGFATKPRLVTEMLARALDAGVPFRWFAADSGYGRDPDLREFCHQHAVAYVLAVPCDLPLVGVRGGATRPDKVLRAGGHMWERRSAGSGTKGRRIYDWAVRAVTVKDQAPAGGYAHHLLIRRSKETKKRKDKPAMHEIEYFLVHAPADTAVPQMIRAAGLRWKIEQDNQTGKDQLGLDHYQVRKYIPWYRHVTLAMLAAAFLTVTRTKLGKDPEAEQSRSVG
jgi:SRSO17 transposase